MPRRKTDFFLQEINNFFDYLSESQQEIIAMTVTSLANERMRDMPPSRRLRLVSGGDSFLMPDIRCRVDVAKD